MTDDYSQPAYQYNKITGSVVQRSDGWHAVIRKWHSETGVERYEESTTSWANEQAASRAVTQVVELMQQRLTQ
jgi:hypothetical protein